MKDKKVFYWEIAGFFFLILMGTIIHFVFEWSGRLLIVGLFSAVNESVWEHLKLGFWSLVIFSLIEYPFVRTQVNNFLLAKALGILVLQGTILIVFYTYTQFTGRPIFLADISSYIAGSLLCQYFAYKIQKKPSYRRESKGVALSILTLHALLLIIFTLIPPELPIFQDSHTKGYGINALAESSKK